KAHCILVDAANKHVYATSLGADTVMEWKFDPTTGTLSSIGPGIIPAKPGAGPRHLALHPSGRYLYLITETTDTIGAYAIDPPTGTLTELQFVRDDGLPDRPAIGGARGRQAISDGPAAQLGRDRRPAVVLPASSRSHPSYGIGSRD